MKICIIQPDGTPSENLIKVEMEDLKDKQGKNLTCASGVSFDSVLRLVCFN